MPERGNGNLGTAAKQVAEHASALTRLEVELAGLELKKKVASLGVGLVLGSASATLVVYGIGFALAAMAVALALVVDLWLALLIATGAAFLLAAILALLARRSVRKATPVVPESAVREAKLTTEAIKR